MTLLPSSGGAEWAWLLQPSGTLDSVQSTCRDEGEHGWEPPTGNVSCRLSRGMFILYSGPVLRWLAASTMPYDDREVQLMLVEQEYHFEPRYGGTR